MIKLKEVSKNFDTSLILKNITIAFSENQTTAILGPSGGGKSTLLRCIAQLEEITSGQIYFREKLLTKENGYQLGTKVGMVFQNFNLFPHFSVLKNLTYAGVKVLGYTNEVAQEKAMQLLDMFGLNNKCNYMPGSLSGGQKQRVAICRALMLDPELILMDEPTSALDIESVMELVKIINSMRGKVTMVIVTHHVNFARTISDKIAFMDQGELLTCQTTSAFFKNPESSRAKLFLENIKEFY